MYTLALPLVEIHIAVRALHRMLAGSAQLGSSKNKDVEEKLTLPCRQGSFIHSVRNCYGSLFVRQAPSGGGYAGFVTGQRAKMAG